MTRTHPRARAWRAALALCLLAPAGALAQPAEPPGAGPAPEQVEVRVLRAGRALPGVRVRAWRRGLEAGRPALEGQTDARGRCWLRSAVGPLTVVVSAEGRSWLARPGQPLDVDADDTLEARVEAPPGAGPIEVVLAVGAIELSRARVAGGRVALSWAPGEGLVVEATAPGLVPARGAVGGAGALSELALRPGETGALRGRVMGADGLALADAVVRLTRGEAAPPLLAATDRLGWFGFPCLEAGVVALEVVPPGAPVPVLRGDARVLAGEDAEVQLRVQAPGALAVLVRDGDQPLEGCEVQLIDPCVTRFGGWPESLVQPVAASDPTGLARFPALPAGRYLVRTHPPGRGAPLLGEVEVRPGANQRLILEAVRPRELKVRVLDPEGNPVPGVFMDVSMPGINWQGMPTAHTGGDGVATFFDLPPGRAEVHLGREGQWRMVQASGAEATFTWSPAAALTLTGQVEDWSGPVLVACALPDVVHMTRGAAVADGRLEARVGPPGGPSRVFLLARDRRLAPLEVAPGPGGFQVAFQPGARLTGRLVDAESGRGVPGRVRVRGALGGVLEARAQWLGGTDHDPWITVNEWAQATGPEGAFELIGLPPGPLELVLEGVGAVARSEAVPPLESGEARDLGQLRVEPR